MKHVIYGLFSAVAIVFMIIIIMTMTGRTTRENELDNAVSQSVHQALANCQQYGNYSIHTDDELVADFNQILLDKLNVSGKTKVKKADHSEGVYKFGDPNLKLQVDICAVDAQKGLLSVHVKEWYTHPNGKKGSAETSSTAVVDTTIEKKTYEVRYEIKWQDAKALGFFYEEGKNTLYKTYAIKVNNEIKIPINPPSISGHTFVGWSSPVNTTKVTRDMTFVAKYKQ